MDTSLVTAAAAFAAGVATSLHCAGMCGPLACAVGVNPVRYHLSRLLSYGLMGALCGSLGGAVVKVWDFGAMRIFPWIMVGVLVALAMGLEKRIPQPRWAARLLIKARLGQNLGLLTVLIPCGPLWLMLGVAGASGAAWSGAMMMGAFVLGTLPTFIMVHATYRTLQTRLPSTWLGAGQRLVALGAAGMLAWRAALPIGSCCH